MKAKCLTIILIAVACAAAGCGGQAPDVMESNAAYTECLGQTGSAAPSRCAVLNGPLPESGNTNVDAP